MTCLGAGAVALVLMAGSGHVTPTKAPLQGAPTNASAGVLPATTAAPPPTSGAAVTPSTVRNGWRATVAGTASTAVASDVVDDAPSADVSVAQCVINPINARAAIVTGVVVNHDTQSDDYTIIVSIQAGSQVVGSAFAADNAVAVGANAPWSAQGALVAGTGGPLTCTLSYVARSAG